MARRFLTAAVGLPVLWAAIWGGLPWLTILVGIAVCLGVIELYRMLGPSRLHPILALVLTWALLMTAGGHFADSQADSWGGYWAHLALGGGLLLATPWLLAKRREHLSLFMVLGAGYVGFLMAHALMLRDLDAGAPYARDWTYVAIAIVFASDTGAFATGRLLGRRPMVPSISPGKTWEGAVGGFVWAIAAGIVLHLLLNLGVSMWQTAAVSAAAGVAAQAGDLVESKLKRIGGVKDAGSLLPGHGGVLDRLDSIVLAIPVVYYLVAFVLKPSTGG